MTGNPARSLRAVLKAAAICAPLLLSGCGGLVKVVDIDSKPPSASGATIYVNGERRGTTRDEKVKINFGSDPTQRVLIQIAKPRYKPVFQYWTYDEVPEKKVFTLEVD